MEYISRVFSDIYSSYYPPKPETLCDQSRQMLDSFVTQSKYFIEHKGKFG